MILVFAGFSLVRRDLVVISVLAGAIILASQWLVFPPKTAVWHTVVIWMMATIMGVVMHWLRRLLDDRATDVDDAHAQLGRLQVQALTEQRQTEAERAEVVANRLAEQTFLQGQVAEQATMLARSAAEVSQNTNTAATAAEQMSIDLRELFRTAQTTEQITGAVADRAQSAATVIKALEASSAQIMTASDVIQSIAEQTNLLALNATIESARAGESGRGFAVVANEVRELARQSGQNADAINRTLTEVRAQVAAAVTQVLEIANGMTELSDHHHTLAAAIEHQSATVAAVANTVARTADETHTMAAGIRTLEQISLTANR
jgi:methyl-accepting chemotaxis protein